MRHSSANPLKKLIDNTWYHRLSPSLKNKKSRLSGYVTLHVRKTKHPNIRCLEAVGEYEVLQA